jgi:dTDP-4-dehydrorhamnose 3,5-epimerase
LYVPKGFAHGFLTLTDDAWVQYLMTQFYQPGAAVGFRYDDPAFGVAWPGEILVISERDNSWPLLSQRQSGAGW